MRDDFRNTAHLMSMAKNDWKVLMRAYAAHHPETIAVPFRQRRLL